MRGYMHRCEITRPALKPSQKVNDLRLRPIHRANELAPHHAIAVDDVGFRKLGRPVKAITLLVRIAHREQIHPVIPQEALVTALIGINAYRQHGYALRLHVLLHPHQRWHLLNTWRAPRRPEIQHYYLSLEFAKRNHSVGILHPEVPSHRADPPRPRSAIAAGKRQQNQSGDNNAEETRNTSHPAIIMDSAHGCDSYSLRTAYTVGHRTGSQ